MALDMEQELSPFLLFTEEHVQPESPHLKLELALGRELKADSRCYILATIHRTADSNDSPCILSWDRNDFFGAALLFQHTSSGLQKIIIKSDLNTAKSDPQTPFIVDGWNSSLRELASDGGKQKVMMTMPKHFRDVLVNGEKYELLWPGGEIALWDWGTKMEFVGKELERRPGIYLPATKVTLEFDKFGPAKGKEERGSPPPLAESERVPGAPKLTVTLICNRKIPLEGKPTLEINVLYDAPVGNLPITFHSFPFQSWYGPREGYRLYRQRADTKTWEAIIDDTTGFMIVDEPDVSVKVTQDENFASLQPGQTWSTSHRLEGQGVGILPDDVKVGDIFRYVSKGVELDWWDWGGSEDHVDTVVKLPCFLGGRVTEPADNEGRPKLIVPASNSVEFTIV